MSTYWDLYCKTCREWGRVMHWNHGEQQLAALVPALPVIAQLAPYTDLAGYALEVRVEYGPEWQGSLVNFAAAHKEHTIQVRSEYGSVYEPERGVFYEDAE